ncbi:hypothetical protein KEM52_001667, partial [Ascosphaera acerosa]
MSARAAQLVENIAAVRRRITAAAVAGAPADAGRAVRLVAVSKLKPVQDILALHQPASDAAAAQLHFGENYVQELLEKSRLLPPTIRWHFIGGLQSNKCAMLAREVRGLWAVESMDSEKKASLLDKGYGERLAREGGQERGERGEGGEGDGSDGARLRVFVQVNTSGEESKSGVDPEHAVALCRHVIEHCPHLHLQGLMTIGAIARSRATAPGTDNEDFLALRRTRDAVAQALDFVAQQPARHLELSMGMSEDFEGAIAMGSDQ